MHLVDLCGDWLEVPSRLRNLEIRGICCDSRRVEPGDLFVAVPGEVADGHLFAGEAVQAGAVAVLGERSIVDGLPRAGSFSRSQSRSQSRSRRAAARISDTPPGVPYLRVDDSRRALGQLASTFHGQPSSELGVVGVTGTKGKTTTTWLLEGILQRCGRRPALIGTVENRLASRRLPSINTTPGPVDLNCWLREHLDAGGTDAVIEISSHALRQQRVAGVHFSGGVFTNIAPEHLDYHKTFESYLETKIGFFRSLPPSAFAVLSREEKASRRVARESRARVVWYGSDPQDGVQELRVLPGGLEFVWKGIPVRSKLLGYHNLLNILAAMTAGECLGLPRDEIAAAIEVSVTPPGRLEEVSGSAPFRVVVDYAHTDGALEAVLKALRPMTRGRLISIFGCGGDRDAAKRPRMGRVAEQGSDQVIITSDNPRGEPPHQILEEIMTGLVRPGDAVVIEDRREAIGLGIRMARGGDTVLIAGKGHENYQEFDGRRIHFDDREVAREFLREPLPGS